MGKIINTVILYSNEDEVLTYAKSLSLQIDRENIVLVVVVNKKDNTKFKYFVDTLNDFDINVFIFEPNENLGYLNGVIYGYNKYCEVSGDLPEWIVISNTDIKFNSNRFFKDFLNTGFSDDVWCVAPSVYSSRKNSYDNPEYIHRCSINKINKLIFVYERPILATLYDKMARIKGKLSRKEKQNSQFIYSAKGCFFFIRRELATILRDRPYKALMYSEESYIAEIINSYTKKTFYNSTIEVIHDESTTTGRLAKKKKFKYIADSLKVIRDEFYLGLHQKD